MLRQLGVLTPLIVLSLTATAATEAPAISSEPLIAQNTVAPQQRQAVTRTKQPSSLRAKADIELITETERDRDNKINGYGQYLELDTSLGYKGGLKVKLRQGFGWEFIEGQESTEFGWNSTQIHVSHPWLSQRQFPVSVYPQARLLYSPQKEARERFGTDGIVEARLYVGRNFGNGFSLSPYVSYIRAQKYLVNGQSDRARDFGYRLRLHPEYRFQNGLQAGVTFTLSDYRQLDGRHSTKLEMRPGLRYAWENASVIVSAEVETHEGNRTRLQDVSKPMDEAVYAVILQLDLI